MWLHNQLKWEFNVIIKCLEYYHWSCHRWIEHLSFDSAKTLPYIGIALSGVCSSLLNVTLNEDAFYWALTTTTFPADHTNTQPLTLSSNCLRVWRNFACVRSVNSFNSSTIRRASSSACIESFSDRSHFLEVRTRWGRGRKLLCTVEHTFIAAIERTDHIGREHLSIDWYFIT